jgi:hypothetical protein
MEVSKSRRALRRANYSWEGPMKESPVYDQIMQEGKLENARAFILKTLGIRFGRTAAKEFAPALKGITGCDRLTRLYRLALRPADLEQFRRRFGKP